MDEPRLVLKYLSCWQDKGIMIDVGAHKGDSCRSFLESGWSVYAFEPDPDNRACLQSLSCYGKRLVIDERAVSDCARENVPFFRSDVSSGISSLSSFDESHVESGCVNVVSLRKYFEEKEVPSVDFLKVDAEGHDLFVLRGFPWEKAAPKVVICEYEDRKTLPLGYTSDDLAEYLSSLGYCVVLSEWEPIVRYGDTHRWRRFSPFPATVSSTDPASASSTEAWGNIIAFRESIDWGRFATAAASCVEEANRRRERRWEALETELADTIAYMERSWSWRITCPLRAMMAGWKRSLGKRQRR